MGRGGLRSGPALTRGWAGGALVQRNGPRAGWKGEGKWAGELLGPRGKKRRGAGLGCFWGLGWLGLGFISFYFFFSLLFQLTQTNSNLIEFKLNFEFKLYPLNQ